MLNDASNRAKLAALRKGEIPPEELYGLIHDFGHAMFLEAEPDVVALLSHPDEQIRCVAVRVLTFHWDVGRHRDKLIRLLRQDPNDEVKSFTAAGLGFVFRDSQDMTVSEALIDKVRDKDEDPLVREAAYSALRDVWSPLLIDQHIANSEVEIQRSEQKEKDLEAAQSREELRKVLWMWRQERLLKIDWEFVERIEHTIQEQKPDPDNPSAS